MALADLAQARKTGDDGDERSLATPSRIKTGITTPVWSGKIGRLDHNPLNVPPNADAPPTKRRSLPQNDDLICAAHNHSARTNDTTLPTKDHRFMTIDSRPSTRHLPYEPEVAWHCSVASAEISAETDHPRRSWNPASATCIVAQITRQRQSAPNRHAGRLVAQANAVYYFSPHASGRSG